MQLKHLLGQINFYGQTVLTYSDRRKVRMRKKGTLKISETVEEAPISISQLPEEVVTR